MNIVNSLERVQSVWISTIAALLAPHGEGISARFQEQLITFFDLLKRCIVTGEYRWLESILLEWTDAPTETELASPGSSLTSILSQILVNTFQIARNQLGEEEGNRLMEAILPVFMHAIEFTSQEGTRLRIKHITEELGQARSTLERLEKSKSDFISVAAHELKTPLTLIEGYASMLRDSLPTEDSRKLQAVLCLRGVNAGTKRLREIVDDMIDVSLIDNDLLSLSFQPIWLNHLLTSIRRELDESIQQRHIKFTIKDFPGSTEMIFADGERMYQALKNIITNAIKYTPDGGGVSVDGRILPGFIEVIIKDTGIGIDIEDHTRIFEKFGRLGDVSLHSSGKTKFKGGGPGLGLPITKGIIDAHGGTIWVESEGYDEVKCPGSTFHIMLPLRKTSPDDKTAKLFRDLK